MWRLYHRLWQIAGDMNRIYFTLNTLSLLGTLALLVIDHRKNRIIFSIDRGYHIHSREVHTVINPWWLIHEASSHGMHAFNSYFNLRNRLHLKICQIIGSLWRSCCAKGRVEKAMHILYRSCGSLSKIRRPIRHIVLVRIIQFDGYTILHDCMLLSSLSWNREIIAVTLRCRPWYLLVSRWCFDNRVYRSYLHFLNLYRLESLPHPLLFLLTLPYSELLWKLSLRRLRLLRCNW